DRLEHRASAVGAAKRTREPLSAVVAEKGATAVVDGPADAAPAAPEVVAAVAAQEKGSEAPPGLEENRLLSAGEDLAQPVGEGAREERHALFLGPSRLPLQVHERNLGKRAAVHAPHQPEQLDPAVARGLVRLHRGRRGAEEESGARRAGADRGDVPRVVARRLALLVGAVLLLVDHEEPGIG